MAFFNSQQPRPVQPGQPIQFDRRKIQEQAQRDFDGIRANPAQYIQRAGVNIPQEIQNDPRAMCMHLLNSGQVPANRLQIAQPLINMLMGGGR